MIDHFDVESDVNALLFDIHSPKSSAHSVLPISPYSSASQLARTIVLSGFHPLRRSLPRPRMSSYCVAVPELGSDPPRIQATIISKRAESTRLGLTIAMVAKDDDLVGDVAWDSSHGVYTRSD